MNITDEQIEHAYDNSLWSVIETVDTSYEINIMESPLPSCYVHANQVALSKTPFPDGIEEETEFSIEDLRK